MISPRPKAQLIRENVRSFVHSNSRPPLPYYFLFFLFLFRFVVDTDFGFGAGIGPLCVIRIYDAGDTMHQCCMSSSASVVEVYEHFALQIFITMIRAVSRVSKVASAGQILTQFHCAV